MCTPSQHIVQGPGEAAANRTCSPPSSPHVHETPTNWPQVLHHYYRITLVDDKGAAARESVLVPCHQVRGGW